MKEDQIRNLKALLQRLDVVRDKITARKEGKENFNGSPDKPGGLSI